VVCHRTEELPEVHRVGSGGFRGHSSGIASCPALKVVPNSSIVASYRYFLTELKDDVLVCDSLSS